MAPPIPSVLCSKGFLLLLLSLLFLLLWKDHYHVISGWEANSANPSKRVRSMQAVVREGREGGLPKCLAFMENFILFRDMEIKTKIRLRKTFRIKQESVVIFPGFRRYCRQHG